MSVAGGSALSSIPGRLLVLTVLTALLLTTLGLASSPSASAARAARRPAGFGAVTATPGPAPGQITIRWRHDRQSTTSYRIETALTPFGPPGSALPRRGRQHARQTVSRARHSVTLTAKQVARAGAGLGTGAHLYVRVSAVNTKGIGSAVRRSALLAVMPKGRGASPGAALRVASFNVRTAKARSDKRTWLKRKGDVAASIARHRPTVVALQELGPGRADGKHGSTAGTVRQTDSLVRSLAAVGASRYRLVRTTPYVKPGRRTGTQGARILYDSRRLALLSACPERTGARRYSGSCSIRLPLLKGDSENHRRRAAYAKFRIKATGRSFYLVSVHLDARHSRTSVAREARYTKLRARQVRTVLRRISRLNTRGVPVVIAGDLNSWQRLRVGNLPHDQLVKAKCYDTASAARRVNLQYSTLNNFAVTQRSAKRGYAPRLDVICIQGRKGADRFVNVTNARDTKRPSDHNLIYADTRL